MKKRGTTLSSVVLRPSLKTADNCWLFGSGSFWCKEVFFLSFFFFLLSLFLCLCVCVYQDKCCYFPLCLWVCGSRCFFHLFVFVFLFWGARVMYVCAPCYRECVWMAKPKVCPNFLTSTKTTTTTTTIPSRLPSPASPLTTSSTSSSRAKFFPFLPKLLDRVATLEK